LGDDFGNCCYDIQWTEAVVRYKLEFIKPFYVINMLQTNVCTVDEELSSEVGTYFEFTREGTFEGDPNICRIVYIYIQLLIPQLSRLAIS